MRSSAPGWSQDLLERRRGLHARIDSIALTDPDAAARFRLDLYTLKNDYNEGGIDMTELENALRDLAAEVHMFAPHDR